MFCPNCGNKLIGDEEFCSNCGNRIDQAPKTNNNVTSTNKYESKKSHITNKKRNKLHLVIIIAILLVTAISVTLFLILNKKENPKHPENVEQEENVTTIKSNTHEKLKKDYEAGEIDVNKYFTELLYHEYDSSKLDKKYKSDYEYYSTGCQNELLDILENHEEELDESLVKKYLENVSLSNIVFEEEDSAETQANSSEEYEVKLLKSSDDEGNAANHTLNKVHLSSRGHFLIWYSNLGSDAITEAQLRDISVGLENAVSEYEKKFNVEYSYNAYVDNKYFNDDYNSAKNILKQNNISLDTLKSAMSIYIFDTGSDSTLATYIDEQDAAKIINRSLILDILDEDGVINYPYIVINKKGFSDGNDSLSQLYNHELFHHFQFLFCKAETGERCVAGSYTEGMANFASALVSDVKSTNNFLNNWAAVYTKNTSSKLSDITDGASYGYGTFPYFYGYSESANNWASILMNAHKEIEPYAYIQNNTPKEELVKTIDGISYKVLTKGFKNNSLYTDTNIKLKETISKPKNVNATINPGAIDYYEISGDNTLKVTSDNKDYVSIKFYGYKDGKYTEIVSNKDSIEVDLTYYVRYDKFYLSVSNGNIIDSYSYDIEVKRSEYETNSEFVTTFNNYNIEVNMDITIAGITTNTVSKGIVDELHQKEYLDVTTTSMGLISLNNKVYYDFNTGYTYMTQPYGGDVWWKEKSATELVDLGTILNRLISLENVTKESDNHYKVKITTDDIKGLMSSGNADTSYINGDIYVDVYTDSGYIVKLEYDFTNLIDGFDLFTTTINYSNYDAAGDVEIPQSIIDNAIVK